MKRENFKSVRRNVARIMSVGLWVGVVSCDTDVVNPGPVNSDFLDDPASQAAIKNGVGRALADTQNWLGYTSAAIARELHPSGSTGSFGITPEQQRGELNDDEVVTDEKALLTALKNAFIKENLFQDKNINFKFDVDYTKTDPETNIFVSIEKKEKDIRFNYLDIGWRWAVARRFLI